MPAEKQLPLHNKYTIDIYDSIQGIEETWSVLSEHDLFFSIEFLRCVELFPATGIKPFYCIVKDNKIPVGIIYFQSKFVKLKENLRKSGSESNSISGKIIEPLRDVIVNSLNFHTIICGNLLLTGKYGFCFDNSIEKNEQFQLVSEATEKLTQLLRKKDINPGLILIKDFFNTDLPTSSHKDFGFTKFTVQPKMILDIKSSWTNFEDYLEDMKSKYRVRARKAISKAADIKKIIFESEDITNHRDTINALYKNVSDLADFNAFVLHEKYFESLKAALGNNMTFTTYWRDDKMIAFFTSIKNYDVLDAHFLGYDPDENTSCQLYLNMLYDLVKEGLHKKVRQIDMSRTAIEIKSTVGAIPYDMVLYLKHTNFFFNKTVATILGFVKPSSNYIIRSPFRDETPMVDLQDTKEND